LKWSAEDEEGKRWVRKQIVRLKRGYWEATEAEMESLRDMYLKIEGDVEEKTEGE
jgi:hypothetical protein